MKTTMHWLCAAAVQFAVAGAWTPTCVPDVVIPDDVTSLPQNALANCASLRSVTFPTGFKEIGSSAFRNTGALKAVSIPAGVSVGAQAFADSGLEEVVFADGSPQAGVLQKIGFFAFQNTKLRAVTLPSSLHMLSPFAFQGCLSLESVTVTGAIYEGGWRSFEGSGLKTLTFAEGVTEIQAGFMYLPAKVVNFPSTLKFIRERAFAHSSLESVVLPAGLMYIGMNAFAESQNLRCMSLPQGLRPTPICEGCRALAGVTAPAGTNWRVFFNQTPCRGGCPPMHDVSGCPATHNADDEAPIDISGFTCADWGAASCRSGQLVAGASQIVCGMGHRDCHESLCCAPPPRR